MNTQPFAKSTAETLDAIQVDDVAPVEVAVFGGICRVSREFESGSSIFCRVVSGRILTNMMRPEESFTLSAAN